MKEWRRKFERVYCCNPPLLNIPIIIRTMSGKKSEGIGIIRDISLGGIGMETRMPLKNGNCIYVTFSLAEDYAFVNAKCTIRRIVRDGIYSVCGIEFDSLVDKPHLQDALAILKENTANMKPKG